MDMAPDPAASEADRKETAHSRRVARAVDTAWRDMSFRDRLLFRAYFAITRSFPDALAFRLIRASVRKRGEDVADARVGERLGHDLPARPDGRIVWLHCVGPGDGTALLALVPRLLDADPEITCVVTSRTASAQKIFSGLETTGRVIVQLAPYDTYPAMRRFIRHWRPALAVFNERDFWPNALRLLSRIGARMAITNAQFDGRLGHDLRKRPGIGRWMMAYIDLCHVYSPYCEAEAPRWLRPDAKLITSYNLKLDRDPPPVVADLREDLRSRWQNGPIVTAASVDGAEVPVLVDIVQSLRADGLPVRMVIAPRWKEHADAMRSALRERGISFCSRSVERLPEPADFIFLADSYGELGTWFSLSRCVFMGHTWPSGSGHNPYEPVLSGCHVVAGSYSTHFNHDFHFLESLGLCHVSPSIEGITERIMHFATADAKTDPAFAEFRAHRGFSQQLARALVNLEDG